MMEEKTYHHSFTELMIAIIENKTYEVIEKKILEKPDEINLQCQVVQRTALIITTKQGRDIIIELLLKNGADPNIRDRDGINALMLILRHSKKDTSTKNIINLLLEYNTNVNLQDNLGKTALMIVASKFNKIGYENIINLLLKHGANVNQKDNYGSTALMFAAAAPSKDSDEKVLKILLENGSNIDDANNSGVTALLSTIMNAHYGNMQDKMEFLLNNGANINLISFDKESGYGWTPLVLAIRFLGKKTTEEIIELLLKYGADVNIKSSSNKSPLYFAAKKENKKIVKLILDYGADIKTIYKDKKLYNSPISGRMLKTILKYSMKKRIQELEKENYELKYRPGNPGYLESLEHFREITGKK